MTSQHVDLGQSSCAEAGRPTAPKLLVVGNGMAGMRTVEEILARCPGRYDITVVGAEPHPNYNRILLSPVLAGETAFGDIVLNDRDWYAANGITLVTGDPVTALDRGACLARTESGRALPYDVCLLATGSLPILLPLPGRDLDGVLTFRDIADVERMLAAKATARHAVVIGGGLLGLEAAAGLAKQGLAVTVIHLMDTLMERQLDASAGYLLAQALSTRGITVRTGADTAAIEGDGRVERVRLKDGTVLPADLVVMAVGIRPNTALAKAAGLTVERGIVVDDGLLTSDPAIHAVGECVQHRGACYGLVAPLWEMAKVIADRLAGKADAAYTGSVTATRLKVTGIDLFSAGNFQGGDGCEDIVFRDAARGVYKRLVLKDDRITGAVLFGDAADGPWFFDLLRQGAPVATMRDLLIFGPAFATGAKGGASDPRDAVAALPASAEICGCNGVCKGTIVAAITAHGLDSVDAVKARTKASASCGSCAGLVDAVLAVTLGAAYTGGPAVKPICGCTDHTHDDVRRLIRSKSLKSLGAVVQELNWRSADGCATCRPALNYYLLAAWPGEYRDDPQSRFVNERMHANIQRDGTYSVVPRMWGGLTNARELRAIADVVDKFAIPTVKVTGGQRIDLLGVKREDLPAVWADLGKAGMVSGHAYGKALRTVKTCVGQEWCRFGTQMSMTMGVQLEKMTWGSWMPHKFKMAVSGCPRNCAEATIKDFGVIAVDSGWELHVGGNGGIHLRGTDLLCKVETAEEVLEYCAAFVQLYREEARYLERTAPWVERVGLAFVKARIVEDRAARTALVARFDLAQSVSQDDPWAERAATDGERREFEPLADLRVGAPAASAVRAVESSHA